MLTRQSRAAARGAGISCTELSRFQVGSARAEGPQGQGEPLLEQQQGHWKELGRWQWSLSH